MTKLSNSVWISCSCRPDAGLSVVYLAKAPYPLPLFALRLCVQKTAHSCTFFDPWSHLYLQVDKGYATLWNHANEHQKEEDTVAAVVIVICCPWQYLWCSFFSPHPSSLGSFSLFFSLALFSPFFPPPFLFCFCCLSWRFSTTDSVSPVNTTVVLPNPATRPSTHTKYYHLFILFPF